MSINLYILLSRGFILIGLYYIQVKLRNIDYYEWLYEGVSQLRNQKGVSAREISLALGQRENYINKIENRSTLPSLTGYIYDHFNLTP